MAEERLHKMVDGAKVYLTDEEEAAIRAEWAKNKAEQDAIQYKFLRQGQYMNIGDQLDAIYKGFDYLIKNGQTFPQETTDWVNKITEVKIDNPKPADAVSEKI